MDRRKFQWMFFAMILAAFSGGVCFNLWKAEPVFAQKKSAQFSNVVKAESFELVDKNGKTRAKLMMGNDDTPTLVVYDKNEKAVSAYGLNGDGPIQNLLDRFMRP